MAAQSNIVYAPPALHGFFCMSEAADKHNSLEIKRMLEQNDIARSTKVSITILVVVGACITLLYCGWFFVYLGDPLSPNPSNWGTFGDYIGGILNPLIASFALYWLVTSVRLQKQELNETRKELVKARTAQELQARMQLFSSQISGWSVRLDNVLRDIQSVREDVNFMRDGLRNQTRTDLIGRPINHNKALEIIESLADRERLLNEMRETIDSEMKKLLNESASTNL